MRFYPEVPSQRVATVVRDLVVVVLLALFAVLAVKVHAVVDELAVLGQGVEDAGTAVEGGFERAANAVEGTPLIGDDVADGLRSAGEGSGGNVAGVGRDGQDAVHRLANVLGLLTFLIPALLVLFQTLPRRIAQVRCLTAANRVLAGGESHEHRRLLAMRAAFSLPYATLLAYTPDPFGDLATERYDALANAALEDAGLRPRPTS
jgi:hypothetical protein